MIPQSLFFDCAVFNCMNFSNLKADNGEAHVYGRTGTTVKIQIKRYILWFNKMYFINV